MNTMHCTLNFFDKRIDFLFFHLFVKVYGFYFLNKTVTSALCQNIDMILTMVIHCKQEIENDK